MDTGDDCIFQHDEADVTMVSFVLEAAKSGQSVIQILSDDTDVFILLVYWVYRADLQCNVQMERWDGSVLDINATCASLGQKCLQLPGMHALSGCDTTFYPYGKGNVTALNNMVSGNYQGLATIGDIGTTHTDLMNAALQFFSALYSQPSETSMESARYNIFTKKKRNPKEMALPPISANLLQRILRAHLQVMVWKAANCEGPPDESSDITNFGWEFPAEIPIPVIAEGYPAPPELLDVIQCQCKAQGKKCSTEACGCHKQHLSCTSFCNCHGGQNCLNPFTSTRDIAQSAEEESETEDIDSNHPDELDNGLGQDNQDGGVPPGRHL